MILPRHRPGRRVRTTNLQALVEAAGTDPLAGNYTLVPQNDIVAGFLVPASGSNDTFTVQAFPLSGSSGSEMTIASGATMSGMSSSSVDSLPVATAVGRFTAGTKDSVALIGANPDGIQVTLGAFDDQDDSFAQLMSGTLLSIETPFNPIVLMAAAGYFTSQATAQLAVVYATPESGGAVLIFDLSGSSPKQIASQSLFGNNTIRNIF